ncbi:hypothetical protein ACWDSF_33165 [Nocardia beijingensis]
MTHEHDNLDQEKMRFKELTEQSSLGTEGARQLRARVSDEKAATILREARKRRRMEAQQAASDSTEPATDSEPPLTRTSSTPDRIPPDDSDSSPLREIFPHRSDPSRKRLRLPRLMFVTVAGSLILETMTLFGISDRLPSVAATIVLAVSWVALASTFLIVARPKHDQLLRLILFAKEAARERVSINEEKVDMPIHR